MNEKNGLAFDSIINSCKKGELNEVKTLLEANPNLLEAKDSLGQTPLLWAAAKGHLSVVNYPLEKGAEVNVATACPDPNHEDQGKTPLCWAIENKHDEVALKLIEARADINVVAGSIQFQPIHFAARSGSLTIVEKLLEINPALLEAKDKFGQTPLLWAAESGHLSIVDCLLSKGTEVNVATNRSDPSHEDQGKTPLCWAIQKGHDEVALKLIETGADINIVATGMQFQPIHFAARSGSLTIVEKLLEINPALLEAKDNFGQTPLLWAAAKGHLPIVEYLLNKDAQVNVATDCSDLNHKNQGKTPLYWAIENDHENIAKRLIQNGSDIHLALVLSLNSASDTSNLILNHPAYCDLMKRIDIIKARLGKEGQIESKINAKVDALQQIQTKISEKNSTLEEIRQFIREKEDVINESTGKTSALPAVFQKFFVDSSPLLKNLLTDIDAALTESKSQQSLRKNG